MDNTVNLDASEKWLRRQLVHADKYPLAVRIAARLHLDGLSYESFRTIRPKLYNLPDPLVVTVENNLRHIEMGIIKIDATLKKLAGQL